MGIYIYHFNFIYFICSSHRIVISCGGREKKVTQETKKKRPFCEKESFFILNQEKVHAKNHEIA